MDKPKGASAGMEEKNNWIARADKLLTELDPTYAPVDAPVTIERRNLSTYQQRVFGGLAINGRFK